MSRSLIITLVGLEILEADLEILEADPETLEVVQAVVLIITLIDTTLIDIITMTLLCRPRRRT